MPYFFCRLATEDGRILSESFFSPSPLECRKHYESKGLCVLSIKRDWKKLQIPTLPFEMKIRDKDFIMFNQELVALIKAGYPILKGLAIIIGRMKNAHFKELLMRVEKEIRAGKSLSEAFSPFEKNFSKVYTASLMAGERSGNLAGTINRFINYLRIIAQTKSRIRSALAYPSLLLGFSFLLFLVLINFILPRFSTFYADFDSQLPPVTRVMMSFSTAARSHFYVFPILLLLLIAVYIYLKKRPQGQIVLDRIKLKIPGARSIWLESAISLFARTLGLLLEGGISLLAAIAVAPNAVPNKYLIQKMSGLTDNIKNGESLSESLKKANFFSPLALDMIRIGESSANLEGMLSDVAEVYDERVRGKIDTFVSLVEPLIIIFMGLVVGGMLLAVYLPIFNIIKIVR